LLNVRKIQHKHTETLELFNPAAKSVECGSAHHASRAAYNGYIVQAFDLVLKFHTSIHTHQPWKKFRDRSLPYRRGNGAKVTFLQINPDVVEIFWANVKGV
jgi:hypothetical protein